MMDVIRIDLVDGKYTYLCNSDGTNQRAFRYGEPWRDLVGDGFVMAMAQEIERLRQQVQELQGFRAAYLEQVELHNQTLDELRGVEELLKESQKNDLYAMRLLAESQAREAKLREVLNSIWMNCALRVDSIKQATKEALALPQDDTALKEYLADHQKAQEVGITDVTMAELVAMLDDPSSELSLALKHWMDTTLKEYRKRVLLDAASLCYGHGEEMIAAELRRMAEETK